MEKTNDTRIKHWRKLLQTAREKTAIANRGAAKEAESPSSYAMPSYVVEEEIAAWKALKGIHEVLLLEGEDKRIYLFFYPEFKPVAERTIKDWNRLLDAARYDTHYEDPDAKNGYNSPKPGTVVMANVAKWQALKGIPIDLLSQEDMRFYDLINKKDK